MSAVAENIQRPPDIPQIAGPVAIRHAKAYYLEARQRVQVEMDSLIHQSRINVSPVYLQLHRHKSRGYNTEMSSLRWRFREAGSNRHLLWSDVQELLPQLPAAVARHYERLNQRLSELNAFNLVIHQTLRTFESLASKTDDMSNRSPAA